MPMGRVEVGFVNEGWRLDCYTRTVDFFDQWVGGQSLEFDVALEVDLLVQDHKEGKVDQRN